MAKIGKFWSFLIESGKIMDLSEDLKTYLLTELDIWKWETEVESKKEIE